MHFNGRGLGDAKKSSSLFQSFEKFSSDVILVQETMASRASVIASLANRWSGKSFWSPSLGKQGRGGWLSCSRKNAMLK